jgi:hypothetical protein
MAFRKMPSAEERAEAFEREVAAAMPYSISNEQEARALFRQIHKEGGWREREARTEASRRHLEANPDDRHVAAGLIVGRTCVLETADLAVREAMDLLERSTASVGFGPR